MKISCIIVTYNSSAIIFDCLHALFENNDIGNELEVIIVDNNSVDFELLKNRIRQQYTDSIKIISNKSNGGYGQGNNIGIANATAPIIMIMNPDVRIHRIELEKIYLSFMSDENLCMYGMKQLESINNNKTISYSLLSHYNGYLSCIGNILINRWNIFSFRHMYFSGACFFVRKSMIESCGNFDENIFLYGEENDLHYRILKSFPKSTAIYDKNMQYIHPTHSRGFSENTIRQRVKSNVYVLEKQGIPAHVYIDNEIKKLKCSNYINKLKHQLQQDNSTISLLQQLKDENSIK